MTFIDAATSFASLLGLPATAPQPPKPPVYDTGRDYFDSVKDKLPVIKAWNQNADGTVTLFGNMTFGKDGDVITGDAYDLSLMPLLVSEAVVSSMVTRLLAKEEFHCERRDIRIPSLEEIEALASGAAPLRRYSKETRRKFTEKADDYRRYFKHDFIADESAFANGLIMRRVAGYSRGIQGLAKFAAKFMWGTVLDRDIARATLVVFGRRATLDQYNIIAAEWRGKNGKAGLADRIDTLLPAFVLYSAIRPYGDLIAKDCGINCFGSMLETVTHTPAILRAIGLKPAVWNMLLKMTVPQIQRMSHLIAMAIRQRTDNFHKTSFPAITSLNRLSDFPVHTLPLAFISAIVDRYTILVRHIPALLEGAKIARKKRAIRATAHQLTMVHDALSALERAGSPVGRNVSWKTLLEIDRRWHYDQHMEGLEKSLARAAHLPQLWDAFIGTLDENGCKAVELNSVEAIFAEASEQGHCVASYVADFATKKMVVFRLTDKKGNQTTLGLSRSTGQWTVFQNMGRGNSMAPKTLRVFEKTVLRAVSNLKNMPPVIAIERPATATPDWDITPFRDEDDIPF